MSMELVHLLLSVLVKPSLRRASKRSKERKLLQERRGLKMQPTTTEELENILNERLERKRSNVSQPVEHVNETRLLQLILASPLSLPQTWAFSTIIRLRINDSYSVPQITLCSVPNPRRRQEVTLTRRQERNFPTSRYYRGNLVRIPLNIRDSGQWTLWTVDISQACGAKHFAMRGTTVIGRRYRVRFLYWRQIKIRTKFDKTPDSPILIAK